MVPAISYLLFLGVLPFLLFYYYCKYLLVRFQWHWGFAYVLLFFLTVVLEDLKILPGFVILGTRILMPAFCGNLLLKQKLLKAVTLSSLVVSIQYITVGITESMAFWILASLPPSHMIVLKYMDIIRHLTSILLLFFTFYLIYRLFSGLMKDLENSAVLILTIPLLFISLVEQTILSSIYGDTVIWDNAEGLVFPQADHIDLILLHIFAYIGMWTALAAFQRLVKSMENERTIQLLEMQAREQEIYVKEAGIRYEQTASFRHDIKNHFLVLRELLTNGAIKKAVSYLSNLEESASSLSCPVHTKNAAVDALLGSKLMIAEQNGIHTETDIAIPSPCIIRDIDWCILLANAVDNAIEAGTFNAPGQYIKIWGRLKGNLYLLHIENSCSPMEKTPAYGTGLWNINAVVEKYHGTMEIAVRAQVFYLDILLLLSQH